MLFFRFGVAVRPSCTAGAKYSNIPRQLPSSFAPPRWHSSIMMKSKKSGGYSPKYGALFAPLINVWNIVKKILPPIGTPPFFRISSGFMRTLASLGKIEKSLPNAWSARIFLSAKNKILGRRFPSLFRFHRVWNSFHDSLSRHGRLAGPCGHGEQYPCLFFRYSVQCIIYCKLLVITLAVVALYWNSGELFF